METIASGLVSDQDNLDEDRQDIVRRTLTDVSLHEDNIVKEVQERLKSTSSASDLQEAAVEKGQDSVPSTSSGSGLQETIADKRQYRVPSTSTGSASHKDGSLHGSEILGESTVNLDLSYQMSDENFENVFTEIVDDFAEDKGHVQV